MQFENDADKKKYSKYVYDGETLQMKGQDITIDYLGDESKQKKSKNKQNLHVFLSESLG